MPPTGEVLKSPNGEVQINVGVNNTGQIVYSVDFQGNEVIESSNLGFDFAEAEDLLADFVLTDVKNEEVSESYTMQWERTKNWLIRTTKQPMLSSTSQPVAN